YIYIYIYINIYFAYLLKIIPRFAVSVIKVDKDHPHGVNQTQFEKLVAMLSQDANTIVAEVGVQEFGERENSDLATMLDIPRKEHWPALFIYKRHVQRWTAKYTGHFSLNRLRNFVDRHSDVEWSCAACVLELDRLVRDHLFETQISAQDMLQKAREVRTKMVGKHTAKMRTVQYYIKVMEKIVELGQPAVAMESARLVRLLQEKLTWEKKNLLKDRVDVLYFAFGGNLWRYQEEEIRYTSDNNEGYGHYLKDEL
ncbi:endoplasmic reticulum resident protein 29-like, partial [Tropilaelaps mercedesae]